MFMLLFTLGYVIYVYLVYVYIFCDVHYMSEKTNTQHFRN